MDSLSIYLPPMGKKDTKRIAPNDLREVLKTRLNALMAATPDLNSGPKLARKAKIGLGTVTRARHGASATTIDSVQAMANAFGIQPHELLAYPKLRTGEEPAAYRTTDLDLKRIIDEWHDVTPPQRVKLRTAVIEMVNDNRSIVRHLGDSTKDRADSKVPVVIARPKTPIEIEPYRSGRKKSK